MTKECNDFDPISYKEVIGRSDRDYWIQATEREMASLHKNIAWEIVDKP